MSKHLALLLGLLGWALRALGQAAPAPPPPAAWETTFFDNPAVALPLLVVAAVRHSSELAAIQSDKAIAQQGISSARKSILGSVLLSGSLGYGNIASVTVADQSLPAVGSSASQTHYSTAVNVNLPLDRLLGRRNQIGQQQLQYQKAEQLRQAREDILRQQITDLYQTVLLARKVLALRQQSYHTAQLNYQLAEKQFRAGEALLTDVSQLNDRFINAAIEQENAASHYESTFMLLEDLVGGRVSELMPAPTP